MTSCPEQATRPPKPKQQKSITVAIKQWLEALPSSVVAAATPDAVQELIAQAPKRYTVYEPLVLLPSGSFGGPAWQSLLGDPNLTKSATERLWEEILNSLPQSRSATLTHLAVNEGIPLHASSETRTEGSERTEHQARLNILRSPSALRILHGDFGPDASPLQPTDEDFARAFWVSVKQSGTIQTWAPRWTMFSRGNIKEKARLLEFHSPQSQLAKTAPVLNPREALSVDLYAGIGYFTFSLARLGTRVLCWELNPWSVEALRRGAAANGWGTRVVKGYDLLLPAAELIFGDERIVVFLEDNQEATRRIADMRASGMVLSVAHVNCGLLPTSEPTWRSSWDITAPTQLRDAWLHLHENVGTDDIEKRRCEIQELFDQWAATEHIGGARVPQVEHVEKVKTYAPGVWHCVFDIHITKSTGAI